MPVVAVLVGLFTALCFAVVQHRPAYAQKLAQGPLPFAPELLLNKITVVASNTPTQTTIISVTNPLTSAAGVAVTIYKGSEAGNQQACSPIVSTLDPNTTTTITLTDTPCGAVDFFGEATINSDKVISATSKILRITTHFVALGGNCGASVGRCYASPQAASDIAADGDSIKVAQGTYTSEAFQVLFLNRAITMTGGYTTGNWSAALPISQPVILDGRNNPGQRVVQIGSTGNGTLTLNGLTIQRGNFDTGNGAGINILTGTVRLRNVKVLANSAADGAGISYVRGMSVPLSQLPTQLILENVALRNNTVISGGRGAALIVQGVNVVITGSQIISNQTVDGSAIDALSSNLTLGNSTVSDTKGKGVSTGTGLFIANNNLIQNNVGAGLALANSDAIISNNLISANQSPTGEGGGIAISSICSGTVNVQGNDIHDNVARVGGGIGGRAFGLALSHNNIENNRASESGGGLHFAKDLVITECDVPAITLETNHVQGNSAPQAGALFIDTGVLVRAQNDLVAGNVTTGFQTASVHVNLGRLEVLHWTVVDNGRYGFSTSPAASNQASVGITNSIIAGHSVGGASGNSTVDHSLFYQNGSTCTGGATCSNTLSGDPKFYWPQLKDYHICQGSPALDQALASGVNTDFDNEPRPQGDASDIGADEWDGVNCRVIRATLLPILLR